MRTDHKLISFAVCLIAVSSSSSSSSYGSTTLYAEFWPSQPIPFIFFYPGQGSSSLALLISEYLF
jgi:hypothetical protein